MAAPAGVVDLMKALTFALAVLTFVSFGASFWLWDVVERRTGSEALAFFVWAPVFVASVLATCLLVATELSWGH